LEIPSWSGGARLGMRRGRDTTHTALACARALL
jgi:hypothetical protein